MQSTTAHTDRGIGKQRTGSTTSEVRHTKEDALDDLEFELLVDASYGLKPKQDLETRFVLLVGGRLGLRRGELAHMAEEWINWRDRRIEIPAQEPCTKGRDGGICGQCRQKAKQKAEIRVRNAAVTVVDTNRALERDRDARIRDFDRELERAADGLLIDVDELLDVLGGETALDAAQETLEEFYHDDVLEYHTENAWTPKTENAVREVPFGFSGRTEIVVERYFDEWDQWMYCGNAINRRLDWVTDEVDAVESLHPHALRSTAASFHAGRGLRVLPLQNMFGWADPETARRYIAKNPNQLDRELRFTHA